MLRVVQVHGQLFCGGGGYLRRCADSGGSRVLGHSRQDSMAILVFLAYHEDLSTTGNIIERLGICSIWNSFESI